MKLSVATLLALGAVLAGAIQQFGALQTRVALLEYWQRYHGIDQPMQPPLTGGATVPTDAERRAMDDAEWYGHTHGP